MVLTINVVISDSCPACKMCTQLMHKVKIRHPDLNISYLNASDKNVRRFQKMNLNLPVANIRDAEMRKHYEEQGLTFLNGLPTIYAVSSNRPMRILDMMVGFISPNADYDAQRNMLKEMDSFIRRVKIHDSKLSMANESRFPRRRDF